MSLFDYLEKHAEEVKKPVQHGTGIPALKDWFKPYEHQEKAVQKLFGNKGKMILAHEMGTGKTVTSIYGFEKMKHRGKAKKALVVVPSSLRENFAVGGIEKFTNSNYQVIGSGTEVAKKKNYIRMGSEGDKDYTIVSYAMFRRDPEGLMKRTGADTIIFDEFHKTRNEKASTFKAAIKARPHATNFMGLTASLINNSPSEIASLLTISEQKRHMSPVEFRRRYVRTVGFTKGFGGGKKKITGMKNVEELKSGTQAKIDYVETGDLKGKTMPTKKLRNVDVQMSPEQYQLYQLALDKVGPIKERVMRNDPNVTVRDAKMLFAQISQARQLANSIHTGRKDITPTQSSKITPKVSTMLKDTVQHLGEKPDNKVVLYSNLVRGGVDVLSAGLKARGIDHAVFVGKGTEIGGNKVTGITRQQGVRDYKEGKKKVIILSGAGAEGLDLKNSTAFFSLDGHFNPQRILQAEARARRLGGQEHRDVKERSVDVRRYRSTVPKASRPGFFGKLIGRTTPRTTDQWMYDVAGRKFKTQKAFYSAFKKPPKHTRKYIDEKGKTRYEYPKKPSRGLFARLFGGANPKPPKAPEPPEGI
jgi:hypothetical protein